MDYNTTSTTSAPGDLVEFALVSDFLLGDAGDDVAMAMAVAAWRRSIRRRAYLTNRDLQSPEQACAVHMLREGTDGGYITCMGFDRAAFHGTLLPGFARVFDSMPVPLDAHERKQTLKCIKKEEQPKKRTRIKGRKITADAVLALVLHYLNSPCREEHLQLMFGMPPATLNRYLNWGLMVLDYVTSELSVCSIRMPSEQEMEQYSDMIVHFAGQTLDGTFGFLDGLKLPIAVSSDPIMENACYNGWTSGH